MTRTSTAVVIRHVRQMHKDADRDDVETTFYGPFLPHVGSATSATIDQLRWEDEENPDVDHSESYVETVFIGQDESDAAVVAVR